MHGPLNVKNISLILTSLTKLHVTLNWECKRCANSQENQLLLWDWKFITIYTATLPDMSQIYTVHIFLNFSYDFI